MKKNKKNKSIIAATDEIISLALKDESLEQVQSIEELSKITTPSHADKIPEDEDQNFNESMLIETKEESNSVFKANELIPVIPLSPPNPELLMVEYKENLPKESNSVFLEKTNTDTVIENKKEEQVRVFALPKANIKQVYQITYFENKEKEVVFFTNEEPEFKAEYGVIRIYLKNCFKKYTLAENILNKKVIKVSYRGEQNIPKFDIDLRIGVVLKTIDEVPWMKVGKDKAENVFKTKVLESYREFAKSIQIAPTTISDNDSEFEKID